MAIKSTLVALALTLASTNAVTCGSLSEEACGVCVDTGACVWDFQPELRETKGLCVKADVNSKESKDCAAAGPAITGGGGGPAMTVTCESLTESLGEKECNTAVTDAGHCHWNGEACVTMTSGGPAMTVTCESLTESLDEKECNTAVTDAGNCHWNGEACETMTSGGGNMPGHGGGNMPGGHGTGGDVDHGGGHGTADPESAADSESFCYRQDALGPCEQYGNFPFACTAEKADALSPVGDHHMMMGLYMPNPDPGCGCYPDMDGAPEMVMDGSYNGDAPTCYEAVQDDGGGHDHDPPPTPQPADSDHDGNHPPTPQPTPRPTNKKSDAASTVHASVAAAMMAVALAATA